MIEGFEYKSYPAELVREILVQYLAGSSLEKLSLELEGVSFAGAQRVIDYAVSTGVLSADDKHKRGRGGGLIKKRAKLVWERHPEATTKELARLASCGESTVYRAKKG